MTIRIEVVISYVGGLMLALLDLLIIGSSSSGWFVEFLTFASLPFWLLAWATTEFVTGERLFANGLDGASPPVLNLLFDGFFYSCYREYFTTLHRLNVSTQDVTVIVPGSALIKPIHTSLCIT